jgi:hypothetical protein
MNTPIESARLMQAKAWPLLLLLYVALAVLFSFTVGLPSLRGETTFEVFADSETYHELAESDATLATLAIVNANVVMPVLVSRALGNDFVLTIWLNLAIFLLAMLIVLRRPELDAALVIFLLGVSPMLFTSFVGINKEVFGLLATVATYSWFKTRRPSLLFLALLAAVFVRWQMILFVMAVFVSVSRLNPLRRSRAATALAMLAGMSILYPLLKIGQFGEVKEVAEVALTEEAGTGASGLFVTWVTIQDSFGYWLIIVPKILHLLLGYISRMEFSLTPADVYNEMIVGYQCIIYLLLIGSLLLKGRFRLSEDGLFLAVLYAIVFGITPIFSVRYFLPLHIFMALALSRLPAAPAPKPTPAPKLSESAA